MISVRNCDVQDIMFILENPWEVTKQEIENFGLNKYNHQELAKKYLEHNFGHSFVAVDDNGYPIVAFGMAVLSYTDWVCWSIRSDLYPQNAKEVTVIFNKYLQERAKVQREKDGKFERIILITSVDSEKVASWCKIIGFKKTTGSGIKEYYDCNVGVYVREFY